MGLSHSPKIVTNGLVLALDAANNKSYPRSGTVWSSGWAGSFSNPTYSFDGNLSTATIQNGTATYTFAGGGLSVSGTVRIYVTFGASSGQVSGLPNVIVVDGTDVSSKMAAANVYSGTPGWIDITTEVGSVFNSIVMTGTGGRSNPSIYAVEVNGQILIDAVAVTAWSDLSGNNNTGTLTNGPTFSAANLGSIVFDGTNDYVSVPSSTSFNFGTGDFTVEMWVYPTSVKSFSLLDFRINETNPNGNAFVIATSTSSPLYAWVVYQGGNQIVGSVMVANQWVQLVVNRVGTSVKMFLNGVQIGSTWTTSNTFTDGAFVLGTDYPLNARFFQGNVSTIKVYKSKGLTSDEIRQNYNATKGRFGL